MKATKKLIGAVVALVAALAVSVGATFAWFTSQNTAKVNKFDLTVQDATGNLYIGLSEEELAQAPVTINTSAGAYTSLKLTDVTSDDGVTFKDKGSGARTANTHYFQVDLWFMSSTDVNVYLANTSTLTCSGNADNDIILDKTARATAGANYGGDLTSDGKITTNAANAARVSFVDGSTGKIWEPQPEAGYTKLNLAHDYESYSQTGTWSKTDEGDLTDFMPVEATVETVAKTADAGTITGKELFSLTANTAKKITINIWLEGKDGDCLNSIFADVISTTLEFVGIEAAGD